MNAADGLYTLMLEAMRRGGRLVLPPGIYELKGALELENARLEFVVGPARRTTEQNTLEGDIRMVDSSERQIVVN